MGPRCDLTWNYTLVPEDAQEDMYTTFDSVAIEVLMPITLCCGILGNVGFLLMVYRVPRMRSLTNFYLANLAVSDSLFLLFAISGKIHEYRVGAVNFSPVFHGVGGCLLKYLVVDVSYFASLCMVTLMSLERYYAVCNPVRHRLVSGRRRTVRLTVGSWAVSLAFAASFIPGYCVIRYLCIVWPEAERYDRLAGRFSYCSSIATWSVPYATTLQTIPFFIACTLNTGLYAMIVRGLTARAGQHLAQHNVHFQDHAFKTRDQVARMLVINGAIFFLLLAPFEVVSILLSAQVLTYGQERLALQISRLTAYLNAAINPVVFGLVSPSYRRAFREAFLPGHSNRVRPNPTAGRTGGEQRSSDPTASLQGQSSLKMEPKLAPQ